MSSSTTADTVGSHVTVGYVARRTGHPVWLVREITDRLAEQGVPILRYVQYRMIPVNEVDRIRQLADEHARRNAGRARRKGAPV
jgi:hypothetical protein